MTRKSSTGKGQMNKSHKEWWATFQPHRPHTSRPNSVRLLPVGAGEGEGGEREIAETPSAVAAMQSQLKHGPIPIEFAESIAAGRAGQRAGMLTQLDLSRGLVALIAWDTASATSLMAWHIRNEQPNLVVRIQDGAVRLALAPPTLPARQEA